jgi:hypothetical protein
VRSCRKRDLSLVKERSFRLTKLTPPSKLDVWVTPYHADFIGLNCGFSYCASDAEYCPRERLRCAHHKEKTNVRGFGGTSEAPQQQCEERHVYRSSCVFILNRRPVDALLGLRELFEAHSKLIESSLGLLIGACAKLIGDEVHSFVFSLPPT